jgi:hypothetical protein
LKDLLDDPESRREIERALQGSPRHNRWFARPWTWAAAGGLAAGAALIAFLIVPPTRHPRQVKMAAGSPATASRPEPPAQVANPEKPAERVMRSTKRAKVAPPPASLSNAQKGATESTAADSQFSALPGHAALQPPPLVAAQPNSVMAPALAIPPFAYTILKQSPDGNSVPLNPADALQIGDQLQFRVQPSGSGTLTISEREPNGEWSALADVKVADPGKIYTLPAAPVQIGASVVLRLELVGEETRAKTPPPKRVEITLTPGRPAAVK